MQSVDNYVQVLISQINQGAGKVLYWPYFSFTYFIWCHCFIHTVASMHDALCHNQQVLLECCLVFHFVHSYHSFCSSSVLCITCMTSYSMYGINHSCLTYLFNTAFCHNASLAEEAKLSFQIEDHFRRVDTQRPTKRPKNWQRKFPITAAITLPNTVTGM